MFERPIDELDKAETLELLDERLSELKRIEADQMLAAEHWADLHGCENCDDGQALKGLVPGMERGKVLGGDGNPEVLEFCVAEFAAVQEMSPAAGVSLLADVQDLRFRHPNLRRRVIAGEVRLFRAREVVRRTRHLSRDAALWVDEQIAASITGQSWGRFLDNLEAKIILADPELAEQRRRAAALDRGVRLGRTSEHGLKVLVAKLKAADAIQLDAMASHLARILGALGDPEPFGVRRATAFGYLGNPVRVFDLLRRYDEALGDGSIEPVDPDEGSPDEDNGPSGSAPSGSAPSGPEPSENDADDAVTPPCPACAGLGRLEATTAANASAFVKTATSLDKLNWKRLLPQVTLYVHTTRESLLHPERGGVARMEGVGPITLEQVAEFFGGDCHITVKDVIDLANVAPEDAYEASASLREAVGLVHPGDVFPFASSTSRSMDHDHVIPFAFDPEAWQPGQTHLAGLVRMARFHHRLKTHSAWRVKHPEIGVLLWRSPHGHFFQVENGVTRRLTKQAGQAYWDTSPQTPTDNDPSTPRRDTPRQPRAPGTPLEQRFTEIIHQHALAC